MCACVCVCLFSSAGNEYACNAGDPCWCLVRKIPWRRDRLLFKYSWASLVAQRVKNLPEMWETWVLSLGWEDSLDESMDTHSSTLAWRIPMDRGARQPAVHGVPMSVTQRSARAQFNYWYVLWFYLSPVED